MSPIDYAKLLVSIGAVELRTDPASWFTWASGERAPIYCDNRVVISYPAVRTQIADGLAAAIRSNHSDAQVIAGTATAGIPHAAWVAERLDLPMVYVRGSAKDHGKAKRVEGRALRGERVVLIEDLVSFGGSALAACDALEAEGGKVGIAEGWRHGPAEDKGARWEAAELTDVVGRLMEAAEAPTPVYGAG